MSESVLSGGLKAGEDQTLGDLLDAIVERIQSGQSVDLESWVREHPQHEAQSADTLAHGADHDSTGRRGDADR